MKNIISNLVLPMLCLSIILLLYQKQNVDKNIKEPEYSTIYVNLKEAKKAAKFSQKEILIFFETSWSDSSKSFKENLKDSVIKDAVKDYIICLIDYDKNRDIAEEYNIKSIPSYLVIDENGNIKKYGCEYKTKNIFLKWLKLK